MALLRKRIDICIDEVLGDTMSSDFHGIFGLNCYEYTLWQLMRQANIQDNYATLHLKSFINPKVYTNGFKFLRQLLKNLDTLEKNLAQIYGVKRVALGFTKDEEKVQNFIKNAIDQNKFVYMLYNNYFDTCNYKPVQKNRHEYHCTLITGYDDEAKYFIPLIEGTYNIAYEDYFMMYQDFYRLSEILGSWGVFYLEHTEQRDLMSKEELKKEFIKDIYSDLNDWQAEIQFFDKYLKYLKERFYFTDNKVDKQEVENLWHHACGLHNIKIGISANFERKIRAMSTLSNVDFNEEADRFIKGKQRVTILANSLGRLAIDYNSEKFINIIDQIKDIMVADTLLQKKDIENKMNYL